MVVWTAPISAELRLIGIGTPLTLGELEASASAFTTRFLSFFFSGVTSHETTLAHRAAYFGIKTDKRSGDPELDRAGLPGHPAALDTGANTYLPEKVRGFERLLDEHLEIRTFQIFRGILSVNDKTLLARENPYAVSYTHLTLPTKRIV